MTPLQKTLKAAQKMKKPLESKEIYENDIDYLEFLYSDFVTFQSFCRHKIVTEPMNTGNPMMKSHQK